MSILSSLSALILASALAATSAMADPAPETHQQRADFLALSAHCSAETRPNSNDCCAHCAIIRSIPICASND